MEQNTYEKTRNSDDYDLTKDRIQYIAAYMENFQDHAMDITKKYLKSLGHHKAFMTSLEFNGDSICINYETMNCSCCPGEADYEYMPVSCLWDEDFAEKAEEKIKQQKEAAERESRDRARKLAENLRLKELADLKRLQNKYGGIAQ